MEQFCKVIAEFPDYTIDIEGDIKNIKSGRLIGKAYMEKMEEGQPLLEEAPKVALYKNHSRKFKYVHNLVADAFIPNPKNYKYVKFKDGNKRNCHITNLERVKSPNNMLEAYPAKYGLWGGESSGKN